MRGLHERVTGGRVHGMRLAEGREQIPTARRGHVRYRAPTMCDLPNDPYRALTHCSYGVIYEAALPVAGEGERGAQAAHWPDTRDKKGQCYEHLISKDCQGENRGAEAANQGAQTHSWLLIDLSLRLIVIVLFVSN